MKQPWPKRPGGCIRLLAACVLALVAVIFGHGLLGNLSGPKEGEPGRDGAPTGYTYDLGPVAVTLGPYALRIPHAYIIWKSDRGLVVLDAILPDLEPIRPATSGCFARPWECHRVVGIALGEEKLLPADEQLANITRGLEDKTRPVFGFIQHINTTIRAMAETYSMGQGRDMRLLSSDPPDKADAGCDEDREIREGLVMTFRFDRERLAEWPEIERKVMGLVATFMRE